MLGGSFGESEKGKGADAPLLRSWCAACVTCACHVLDFEPCVAQAQTVAMRHGRLMFTTNRSFHAGVRSMGELS